VTAEVPSYNAKEQQTFFENKHVEIARIAFLEAKIGVN